MKPFLSVPAFVAVAYSFALCGCGTFRVAPVTSEIRAVYPVSGETGIVTVTKDMTFVDSKHRTYSLTIPRGVYRLEAEDSDYGYYALAGLLERAVYDGDNLVDKNFFSGGLMIAKHPRQSPPAGVYRSDGSLNRTLIWRFDSRFMEQENVSWKKTEGK